MSNACRWNVASWAESYEHFRLIRFELRGRQPSLLDKFNHLGSATAPLFDDATPEERLSNERIPGARWMTAH
jgi:hypothetical protein